MEIFRKLISRTLIYHRPAQDLQIFYEKFIIYLILLFS